MTQTKMADERVSKYSRLLLLFCALLALLNPCNCIKRKIELKEYYCPNTTCKVDPITIAYLTATDEEHKNIVHFIWSVYDTPSIIVAYTSKNNFNTDSHLNINWEKLISKKPKGALKWSTKYDYISAFEIAELEELNDPKDEVIFKSSDFGKVTPHDIRQSFWDLQACMKNEPTCTFQGSFLGGNITFMLNASSEDGRGTKAPKQLYSSNGTRFSITLHGLKFNSSNTRISLKLLSHTVEYQGQTATIMEDRSIDDEYSPGVFRTFVINNILNSSLSSFVSWKPVSYVSDKRSLKNQVPSYQYKYYKKADDYELFQETKSTPLQYSKDSISKVIQAAMDVDKTYPLMVSFGQKKDGWYEGTHHLIWSGQVGFGKAQLDSISKTLWVTIFVGLGLPFAFILAGSLYVCFKKYRERMTSSTYGQIN